MTEVNEQPKRRWLRFSLRSFVIVLTIMCVWIGWYVYRVQQQREAVRWVEENGGKVYYDHEASIFPSTYGFLFHDSQPPVTPKWLLNVLDVNYFSSVVHVHIGDGSQITDLTPLADLTSLEWLRLSDTQVSDLKPLAGLKNLQALDLERTQASDLTPLAGLKNLEVLMLGDTPVSDLTPLSGLTNLAYLDLSDTQVSDPISLAGLTNLGTLVLGNSQIDQKEIEKLQQALPNCNIYQN